MKLVLFKSVRFILSSIIGEKNVKKIITLISDIFNINLMMLAYNNQGIFLGCPSSENGETFLISKVLKKYFDLNDKPTLFDIGANVGNYSQMMHEVFPSAIIYAFEPNEAAFQKLKLNINNSTINSFNIGMGSEEKKALLYCNLDDLSGAHSSIHKRVFDDIHSVNEVAHMEFQMTTIDNFCFSKQIKNIDFLKIDTEGSEYDVLKGASSMLENGEISIIQFEFNQMNIISRVFLKDFYDVLSGYNIYRLNSNNLIPIFDYGTINEIFLFQNLIAIHKKLPKYSKF